MPHLCLDRIGMCIYGERFTKPFMPEAAPESMIRQAQGPENFSKVKFTFKGDVNYVLTP